MYLICHMTSHEYYHLALFGGHWSNAGGDIICMSHDLIKPRDGRMK